MQDKQYNFTVNEQEANIIIQALAELPAKISMNVIAKLQEQYKIQIEAK